MKRMLLVLLFAYSPLCADEKASEALPPVVSTETNAATPSNFCGQTEMQRLFLKTEIGKQLQTRQQEALRQAMTQIIRQAMHEAMAKGEISVQEYMQWLTAQEEAVQK